MGSKSKLPAWAGIALLLSAGLSLCALAALLPDLTSPDHGGSDGPAATQEAPAEEAAHAHSWVPQYGVEHREAVYETLHRPAVVESRTSEHTVCNGCGERIDGRAEEHLAETGHLGYTTGVPVTDDVVVREAYDEQVLVSPARDVQTVEGAVCTGCGERLSAEEALEAGLTLPEPAGGAE